MSGADVDAATVVAKQIDMLDRLIGEYRALAGRASANAFAVDVLHQNGRSAAPVIEQLRKEAGVLDCLTNQLFTELLQLSKILNAASCYD